MSFMLKSLYLGFTYRDKKTFLHRTHPVTNLLVFTLMAAVTVLLDLREIIFEACFLVGMILASGLMREELETIKAVSIPLFAFTIITYFYYGLNNALIVFFRVLNISFSLSIMFLTIDFEELASFFNKFGGLGRIVSLIAIASNIVPLVAKDARDTLDALYLKGEIRGHLFRPRNLIVFVTVFLSSILWRVNYLTEALYIKKFGVRKKVIYLERVFNWRDILLLTTLVIFLSIEFLMGVDYLVFCLEKMFKVLENYLFQILTHFYHL